jgi:hypothetical protein
MRKRIAIKVATSNGKSVFISAIPRSEKATMFTLFEIIKYASKRTYAPFSNTKPKEVTAEEALDYLKHGAEIIVTYKGKTEKLKLK